MTEILLTPTDRDAHVALSKTVFRKKILPMGSIDYKGRKINFDRAYLTDLATAYQDGAYDQVPFMLADKDNAHTMDPARFRGECKGVEVGDDGLYGTFELSADAAQMVKDNPKLGVSARIVEGYNRSDGKSYPRAMQHVLGTLDPRIPGLGAWTEVSLSGYDASTQVLDLTQAAYEGAPTVAQTEDETVDGLTDEEYQAMLAALGLDPEDGETEDEPDETEDETVAAAETETVTEPVVATLSNADRTALELAHSEIATLKATAAEDRFKAEKSAYVAQGVPPALVELARPVLTAPDGFTIDLSNGNGNGSKVDAAAILRQMLDASRGYIELARERGHSVDFSTETSKDEDPDKEILDAWAKMDENH
jgi:hypothetical protein